MQTQQNKSEPKVVYRTHKIKFSNELSNKLEEFSIENARCNQKQFKQAWENFLANNESVINTEKTANNTVSEDILLDNMFKSARYYYRKKYLKNQQTETNTKQKPNEKYPTLSKILRRKMETHIQMQIVEKSNYIKTDHTIKMDTIPQEAYLEFCSQYKTEIYSEVLKWAETTDKPLCEEEISKKFKKSYKNMFYKKIKQITQE